MSEVNWKTPRMREVLAELDEGEHRDQFKSLVEDLNFEARRRDQAPYRNWEIIAALVRSGWRGPEWSGE